MKLTKAELEKENTEFKKRHKKLLKANQDSMERRVELGNANSNLLSENEALKAQIGDLQKELSEAKSLLIQYRTDNGKKVYEIEQLKKKFTDFKQPVTTNPKTNYKPTLLEQIKNWF